MATTLAGIYGQDDFDDSDEQQQSESLRRNKLQARRQRKEAVVKNSARAVEASGAGLQAAGKTTKLGGKAVAATGRGLEKAGTWMTRSGAELSATGAGAIVGVPLSVLGGLTTAVGAGTQAAGTMVTEAGQAMDNSGRMIRQEGKQLAQQADNAGKLSEDLRSAKRSAMKDRLLNKLSQGKVGANDDGDSSLISDAFQAGTDFVLREFWFLLIPSWGLTLIWINIHVFLSFVVGDNYFSRLGHEWASIGGAKLEMKATNAITKNAVAKKEAADLIKSVSDKVGFLEVCSLMLLDAIAVIVLVCLLWLFAILLYAIQNIFTVAEKVVT